MDKDQALQSMHLPLSGFQLPEAASTFAKSAVDDPYWLIYWVCVAFFIATMGPMAYFMWRYRRKTKDQRAESQIDHSQFLEVLWSVVPLLFFSVMFFMGFRGFLELLVAPAGAMEVRVTGQKWTWTWNYGDGVVVGGAGATFVIPVGKPVKLVMTSTDVIHSFYVPNFRSKQDVIPGRYTTEWFEATKEGEFPVLCTEYCGTDHSNMLAKIKVVPQADFDAWFKREKNAGGGPPTAVRGKDVYEKKGGCTACHSLDGSPRIGPSFKGLFGRDETMSDGTKVKVDDDYLHESIMTPAKRIVQNTTTGAPYPNVMPNLSSTLSPSEIDSVILFIKEQK